MRIKNMLKKSASFLLVVTVLASSIFAGAVKVDDIKNESRMKLGYSIINGYSKLSERKGLNSYSKAAIYSGLDVTNPYIIALAGSFYFTQGVDLDRAMTDNGYAVSQIEKLNGFLSKMGVKNDRAASLKAYLQDEKIEIFDSYDTVGMYIVKTDTDGAGRLLTDSRVDFVLAGAEVPSTMKDLNMDGKSNSLDAPLIQRFLDGELTYDDSDELEYIKFACDINGDKKLNILDATKLMLL